jgi:hypothetical protein
VDGAVEVMRKRFNQVYDKHNRDSDLYNFAVNTLNEEDVTKLTRALNTFLSK